MAEDQGPGAEAWMGVGGKPKKWDVSLFSVAVPPLGISDGVYLPVPAQSYAETSGVGLALFPGEVMPKISGVHGP